MTERVVEHKIKLEKSVKIILAVLAVGVFLNAFAPVFNVKKASAMGGERVYVTNFPPVQMVNCYIGCN